VTRIEQEILDKELGFDRAGGCTEADDRMPEFMLHGELPPRNVTWDVPNETLDAVFGEARSHALYRQKPPGPKSDPAASCYGP
jgi:hypothetical protein